MRERCKLSADGNAKLYHLKRLPDFSAAVALDRLLNLISIHRLAEKQAEFMSIGDGNQRRHQQSSGQVCAALAPPLAVDYLLQSTSQRLVSKFRLVQF